MTEERRTMLEEVWGGPITEVDPIYHEGAKFFNPDKAHTDIIPFLMAQMYTLDEMNMILALPGTLEEISEKTGFDKEYIDKSLRALARKGRCMITKTGFARVTPESFLYMDMQYWAIDSQQEDYDREDLRFIEMWTKTLKGSWEMPEDMPMTQRRIIPKWGSIKDLPGVMDCENMKTIMLENQAKGEFSCNRCGCQTISAYWNEGHYPTQEQIDKGYINEGKNCAGGHCLFFGPTGRYKANVLGAHAPSYEETLEKFEEAEEGDVIYVAMNLRDTKNICCCNLAYCNPHVRGTWYHAPSRFRPVRDYDKCVACGRCANLCMFDAISLVDGKYVTDPDKCRGCGNCVIKCQNKALEMEIVRPTSWISDGEVEANMNIE